MLPDARQDEVLRALGRVVDPCSIATGVPISLEDMGLIAGVEISGDRVEVKVRLTSPVCLQASNIAEAVCDAVRGLTWVTDARCSFDAGNEWEPEMMNPAVRHELRQRRRLNSKGQAPLATGLVNRRTQKVEK